MHIPEDEAERRRLNERGREILRRKNGAVRPHREDGYVNLLNKYGTKQDNSEAYKFEREPVIPDMQLTGLYEGNGLFSKIIDTPAEEALKHGFDLNLKSDELNAFVEDALDDLEWEERAATAIKWARLYGGALIVMLIDDGRGLEEPVDWEHIRSIDELRVYERTSSSRASITLRSAPRSPPNFCFSSLTVQGWFWMACSILSRIDINFLSP